jgi:membrane protease YdiL (CAAX protease family)
VYGVFIAWLSTEFLVVPLLKGVSKDLANIAVERGSLTVALITAGLYLSQNLPSIFYIWFFAVRNHGIRFAEAIRLRWKTERRGPVGLVLAGVATWFAAIPLVIASTYIANQLGSQGSSNPIVAVVLSSVKDSNPLAVIMFLITLGVLPALCEETLFRGFLYTSLRRRFGAFLSIVISATLFSLAHFDLGGAVQLFVLGALFAFVFERTKSLIPAMVAHCMWNSGTFLMALTMLG